MKHGFYEMDQKCWKRYKNVFEVFLKIISNFNENITDITQLSQYCQCLKPNRDIITKVIKTCRHILS